MKVLLIMIYIAAGLQGCSKPGEPEGTRVTEKKEISILALGDSYTIGEGVASSERWPEQLADSLRARGFTPAPPQIIAVTGWTTGDLSAGMDRSELKERYDLVTLLIGVNNQYRGYDTTLYRSELEMLIRRAVILAGSPDRVLIVSIPDWGVTPFAAGRNRERIAAEIDIYNRIKAELSAKAGCPYFYITDISRAAAEVPSLLAADKLHPSGAMYALWVERMMPAVVQIAARLQ
ncbi:MAG: SGNH/GDSL hydrolase family protein [Ignavibacteriaceae bacterium]|nr:SGNH/GDSL hydrolase family protein [Ignavibacteriaceae bacterium]